MTEEQLRQKQQDITTRFDELNKQGDVKRSEIEQIEDELKRLQGEFRAIGGLLSDVKDPAVTIEAKEATRGRRKK